MTPQAFIVAGAAVIFVLGSIHLAYTYFTPKLGPREAALRAQMQNGRLVISGRTSIWRAWVGFNASHSMGAMFFGAVYGYLALRQPTTLLHSRFLGGCGLAMLLGYLALARLYWFEIPFRGIALATLLYTAGFIFYWLS